MRKPLCDRHKNRHKKSRLRGFVVELLQNSPYSTTCYVGIHVVQIRKNLDAFYSYVCSFAFYNSTLFVIFLLLLIDNYVNICYSLYCRFKCACECNKHKKDFPLKYVNLHMNTVSCSTELYY